MDPQEYGDWQADEMENPDPLDDDLEDNLDPAEEEYLVDDPDENMIAPRQYDPNHVERLIAEKEWNKLEKYLRSFMPTDIPWLTHPQVFLICWRRELTDFMDEEHHNGAAALYAHNIVKLKHTSSPFADKERLLGEIATIEQHVGRRMRLEHPHRVDRVLQTEVNDYMRLYLPQMIGYAPRKTKSFSALWEFCIRLDVPIPGKKVHPKVRCLVCSSKIFNHANVTPMMTDHLTVCPGPKTPNLQARLFAALTEESKRGKSSSRDPENDGNKRGLEMQARQVSSKRPKLNTNTGLSDDAMDSGPLELISEQVAEGMKIISQLRFRRGIEPIETIFMNIKSILSSALGQERTQHQKEAAGPQACVPSNPLQAAAPISGLRAAAPVAEEAEAEVENALSEEGTDREPEVEQFDLEAEGTQPEGGADVQEDYPVFDDCSLPDLPQLSDE